MDLEAVSHESCAEVGADAPVEEAEGVGVPEVVGLDGDAVAVEGVVEGFGERARGLGRAWQVAQVEGGDPGAGTGGDAAGAGLGFVVDLDPVVVEPGELGALVGAEAVGGAHAEGPLPVGQADPPEGGLDGGVCGDVALGELVDAVAPAGFEQALVGDA